MGMTWGPWGQREQHGVTTTDTTAMRTTWEPCGGYGDNVGTMRMMWGQQGQHGDQGDHVGTMKSLKTFE